MSVLAGDCIRHDAYAEAHRLAVEEDKPAEDRGFYSQPGVQNQPAEKSLFLKHDPRKKHTETSQAPNKQGRALRARRWGDSGSHPQQSRDLVRRAGIRFAPNAAAGILG
jgi:hypothetical protein